MGFLQSPLLFVVAAAGVYYFSSPDHSLRFILWPLLFLAFRSCAIWYGKLQITIDGVCYKQNANAKPKAAEKKLGRASVRTEGAGGQKTAGAGSLDPTRPNYPGNSPAGKTPAGAAEEAEANPNPVEEMKFKLFTVWDSFPHGKATEKVPFFWLEGAGNAFDVRNIGYKQTKEKSPSDISLYDVVGADAIRSNKSMIGKVIDHFATIPEGAADWSPEWGVPRVLVVNAQMPYQPGPLLGKHPEDDHGFNLISYHVLARHAIDQLKSGQPSPALNLWKRFVAGGVSTREGMSFKAIGRVENLEDLNLPDIVKKFNGKPVLVTKSATLVSHKMPEILEVDYDVRQWAYLCRQTLCGMHQRMREADLHLAYLVEGKNDEELPEQVLACFQMIGPQIMDVKDVNL